MTIGGMVWRTGELLGLEEQIAWFAHRLPHRALPDRGLGGL